MGSRSTSRGGPPAELGAGRGATPPRSGLSATVASIASALWTAVVAALLLLLNGSFALVVLRVMIDSGPAWLERPGPMQFALFVLPLVLLVVEWVAWDIVRGLFQRRETDVDPWKST